MNTPIISEPEPIGNPPSQYYRISALICPSGSLLLITTGVLVLPDGTAVLGQLRADPDDGTYIVAPFLAPDSTYLPAPADWRAHLLPDPPPPVSAALVVPPVSTASIGQGRAA